LIAVTRRRDVADTWTGWWLTTGTAGAAPDEAMIRIYWNCGPDAVGELVRGLTALLEGLEVPYTFKCPIHPFLFRRTDSVVLYLGRVAWEEVKPWIRDVHSRLGERLRPAVPPLTLRLGAGIAVAEDPGNAESFGQSRAAAVAAGLVRLLPGPLPDDDAVLSTIGGALEAHGISVSRPYLNAGAVEHVLSW
jgi:hypothetical protein